MPRLVLAPIDPALADAPAPAWASPQERARLDGVASAPRRAAFLAARALARQLLVEDFGGAMADWQLDATLHAPPRVLAAPPGVRGAAPTVAISHSGGWAAVAVGQGAFGVDLEVPTRPRDVMALAASVCDPREREALAALAPAERELGFLQRWTLKEAWVKRLGEPGSPGRFRRIVARADDAAEAGATDAVGRTWVLAHGVLGWIGAMRPTLAFPPGQAALAEAAWRVEELAAG